MDTNDELLIRIDQTVSDMHERLFGNGQPGIVQKYDERIRELELDKAKTSGAVRVFKYLAGSAFLGEIIHWWRGH